MAEARMLNTEKVPFTLDPRDGNGNPQPIENLSIEQPEGGDLTLTEISADQKTGFVNSGSTIGTLPFNFKADARIGDGEVFISESHVAVVSVPEATTLGGTFGPAVPK